MRINLSCCDQSGMWLCECEEECFEFIAVKLWKSALLRISFLVFVVDENPENLQGEAPILQMLRSGFKRDCKHRRIGSRNTHQRVRAKAGACEMIGEDSVISPNNFFSK
jgi:hypothetical protein